MHRQPTFQGITFDQSPESEKGIPIWMECAIYRSDLTHPIKVREYYEELKKDHPMWTQMPRRMMRHKTLQQCARLAYEISVYVSKVYLTPVNKAEMMTIEPNQRYPDCKNLLRKK